MWTGFCCTVCYSSCILYFALSCLCVYLPVGFRPFFFFFFLAKNVSLDFTFFVFIMRLGWDQSLQNCFFLILTNLLFSWLTFTHHSLSFLVSDGQFFTWGQNSYGQLGLGKECPSQASPQRVKSLDGIPLAQVAAGGAHSFALSLSGAVFGWGKNSSGQLGLSDERGMKVMFLGKRRIESFDLVSLVALTVYFFWVGL